MIEGDWQVNRGWFSKAERPRVWMAAGVACAIGLSTGALALVPWLSDEGTTLGAWALGTIVVGPFFGARLLPRPHLGAASLVAAAFMLALIASFWTIVLVGPSRGEASLGVIVWTLFAPVAAGVLTLPIYWVSAWRRQ